jgi:hypothetical protein
MEKIKDGGLTVRQTHKSRRRFGPCTHGANKGWRVHSEKDSQFKEEMRALNRRANTGWRVHSETDPQIKEEMWALYPWSK